MSNCLCVFVVGHIGGGSSSVLEFVEFVGVFGGKRYVLLQMKSESRRTDREVVLRFPKYSMNKLYRKIKRNMSPSLCLHCGGDL